MSLCSHCRTVNVPADGGGVLRLTHPLPHTLAKLRRALGERYALGPLPGGVAVRLPAGSLEGVTGLLEAALSAAEREACKVLLLGEGEALTFDKMAAVEPLGAFIAKARSGWLAEMLEQNRFYAEFQPIVLAAAPAKVFAYECLLRGRDAEGNSVPPGLIFETARSAELLFQVDRAARLTAIRDASRHGVETPIFINFNPTAIYDPAFCLRTTTAAIKEVGVTPDRVVFEIVESDAVNDPAHLQNIVRFYRQQGFRVALDDLGAGYGSLNLLTLLRPDFVKFDRELVRGVDADPYKQKVLVKLVEMARELGVHTLAEGVETEDEYRYLAAQGVEYLQGYFFARPASPPPPSAPLLSPLAPRPVAAARQTAPFGLGADLGLGGDALQSVLDSLHEQVAVIDASGKIVMVNRAWREVGLEDEAEGAPGFLGVNYLDVCRAAGHEGMADAQSSYQGLRDVLGGVSRAFSYEYRCTTPQGERWFLMNATPFAGERGGAVVLHMDITDRKRQEAKIDRLAHFDELTGAANRRRFYEAAGRALERAERDRTAFSFLYLDLDGFKGVNDRYGHACGDELLRRVSARLQGLLRDGDLLARFGGDEFVLLLQGVSGDEVEGVAARYRAALEAPFVIGDRVLSGVGSLGAVSYPEHGRTVDELLRRADTFMYREKAGGRPRLGGGLQSRLEKSGG